MHRLNVEKRTRTEESLRCVRYSTLARPAADTWCGFSALTAVVYRFRRSFQAARIAGSVGFDTSEPMT
ncbi:hypothetical protein SAMN04489751_3085 [Brevibacterium sandarakinum]|uniref:Uncharacterized protein n=2 Tax=Brevibacterium TaxID=1696 RepID=A0A1H1VR54_BRESA|nr:hypothetical protein SAMN04489751_3085 [Brevibacterium sandarakinum]